MPLVPKGDQGDVPEAPVNLPTWVSALEQAVWEVRQVLEAAGAPGGLLDALYAIGKAQTGPRSLLTKEVFDWAMEVSQHAPEVRRRDSAVWLFAELLKEDSNGG